MIAWTCWGVHCASYRAATAFFRRPWNWTPSRPRRAFEQALKNANVRPNIVLEIGSREAVWEAVAEGLGIGLVSEAAVVPDNRLKVLSILDAEIFTYTHVVYMKERQDVRLVTAFLDVIKPDDL